MLNIIDSFIHQSVITSTFFRSAECSIIALKMEKKEERKMYKRKLLRAAANVLAPCFATIVYTETDQ